MRRLRPLSEAECYARCYGDWEVTVRVVAVARRRRPVESSLSGDDVRRLFEERIDAREPGVEAEAA